MSEPAAFDHADRPKRYVWRVSARGIAWIRKIFRARENVARCIAAARKKIGIGVILSEVDDFVVCQLIAIGLSTYLQNYKVVDPAETRAPLATSLTHEY